jgi:uncharacterized protein YqeY
MAIQEQITSDLKEAMKNKDMAKLSVLRMISSVVKNKELEKKDSLTDEEVLSILSSEAKKRKEAIAGFESAGRPELAEGEKTELELIQTYLPEQMSEEEVRAIIEEAVKSTGAQSMQEIGLVMKEVMPKVKGKADGNLVNSIVKELLS